MGQNTSNSINLSPWLPALRQLPGIGDKLYQALQILVDGVNQGHANAGVAGAGALSPPPRLDAFNVATDSNGFAYFGLLHNGAKQRGINYFVEHADNPAFVNAHVLHLGTSRNGQLFIGSSTRYFRAYGAYQGSNEAAEPFNFGGSTASAVVGGGSAPATFTSSNGAGTAPSDGSIPGGGFGPVLYTRGGPVTKRNLG